MKKLMLSIFLALPLMAQQPVPNTYIATGAVSNYQTPYHVSPFFSYGFLTNTAMSNFPTYLGFEYEGYLDSTGKPAYGGMATVRTIVWQNNRYFCFGAAQLGAAGSVSSISSAVQLGGGCGLELGAYSAKNTPHWEFFVEPQAQRIPALANPNGNGGFSPALKVGFSYSFNRPQ